MKVMFCPYLAAMWGSMSPLYSEHTQAGDDVMVMPLPYTTRDRNGAPMTYRVDEFPVPVLKPSLICLRDIHPDLLYFHNPYDARNAVTMVAREFHSARLAECTDDLTYVPYYTMPVSPGNDVEHIITAPGVLRAKHIIVYSVESRDKYARVLFDKTHVDWTSRIIVKQRPKPKTYVMPEEWSIIAKGRDLVMFGTSLSAVIGRKEVELEKIRDVISSHQQETCLLWRPHPLYDATLTAMLPGLRRQYREIVETFVKSGQGIFDTSWDLERAVTLCSSYVGDPSSVVGFFREQGKPVRII